MGNDDKKEVNVPELHEYNVALQHLGADMSSAINKYLQNGYVNFAAIIGVLEDMKININRIMVQRNLSPEEKVTFKKLEPASYIG